MGIKTTYVDDLDGTDLGDNARPVRFSVEGKNYSIYLTQDNKKKLTGALEPFISKAETVGGAGGRSSSSSARNTDAEEKKQARAWAIATGFKFKGADGKEKTLGEKGRIPEEVLAAYREAHA